MHVAIGIERLMRLLNAGLLAASPVYCYAWGQSVAEEDLRRYVELSRESADTGLVAVYQYSINFHCRKLTGVLSLSGLEYTTVEVSPITRGEARFVPWKDRCVPLACVRGQTIRGSNSILGGVVGPLGAAERRVMEIVDREVIPAAEVIAFTSASSHPGTSPSAALLSACTAVSSLPVASAVVGWLLRAKLGPAADPALFGPSVQRAFDEIDRRGLHGSAVEGCLFGVLGGLRGTDELSSALEAAGRTAWFAALTATAAPPRPLPV